MNFVSTKRRDSANDFMDIARLFDDTADCHEHPPGGGAHIRVLPRGSPVPARRRCGGGHARSERPRQFPPRTTGRRKRRSPGSSHTPGPGTRECPCRPTTTTATCGSGGETWKGARCRFRFPSAGRDNRSGSTNRERRVQIGPGAGRPVARKLSGGNQQKVAIARWLTFPPTVLIACEPTRGMDVGAKNEVLSILRTLRNEHYGVLVVSSEPETILAVCDQNSSDDARADSRTDG